MERHAYRVIYNQDCTNLFEQVRKSGQTTTAAHVDHMVDEVAEGGADLMLINPNGFTGRVNYPSRVWQTFWDLRAGLEGYAEQAKGLAEQGCDYLSRSLERCRQKRIGAGISVRMNDTHETPYPDNPIHSDFYRQHPEWRIRAPYWPSGSYATVYAMDYRRPEVRAFYLALIRELVSKYRPDALELDFMRFPLFVPPGEGSTCASIMTEFVREVRRLAQEPLILTRMPVTPAAAMDYGFDIAAWAREGLVDGVTVSAHFHTAWDMDLSAWRRVLGADRALYAGTEHGAYCPDVRYGGHNIPTEWILSLNERLLRGFAAAQRAAGADGVYLFNFFCAREREEACHPLFSAIGQLRHPAGLQGKSKTYCLSAAVGAWYLPESDGPLQVPREIPTRCSQAFHISLGPEPHGLSVEWEALVKSGETPADIGPLRLHVNEWSVGAPCAIRRHPVLAPDSPLRAVIFQTTSDVLREGRNSIVLRNDGAPVSVVSVVLHVNGD